MPKIVGIRDVIGSSMGLLSRDVQGYGFYEPAGTVERQFSPYDVRSLGSSPEPYDLNAPGRVAEIKNVLIALGRHYSDPARVPVETQVEDTFEHIDTSPSFADAWDGPTADAYALTVGRHRDRFSALTDNRSPLIQLPKWKNDQGTTIMVGGAQPTVPGIELLAQAAHEVLKDTVQLDQYLAWRGGNLDCLSASAGNCAPPDALVLPAQTPGKPWNPRGWTVPWLTGPAAKQNPQLVDQLSLTDKALDFTWQQAAAATTEKQRTAAAGKLIQLRQNRHELVKQLNEGASVPTCADPSERYSETQGRCVSRCPPSQRWDPSMGVCVVDVDTPQTYDSYESCMVDLRQAGTDQEARAACDEIMGASRASVGTALMTVGGIAVATMLLANAVKLPDIGGSRG